MDSVLKRMGFVKLRDFGLLLTPEGRILSIRPAVLDDGMGGRIVGWKDDDLAFMELAPWAGHGRKPAAQPAVAPPVAAVQTPVPVVVAPAPVAAASVVEEDDWEWTIAIARARAAADETEQAVLAATPPRRMRADTLPPPVAPVPVATIVATMATKPATLPSIPRPRTIGPQSKPVIPIPTMPTTAASAKFSPVVRPAARQMPTPIPPQQPRRFAKGTMPVTPTGTMIKRPGDDTATNVDIAMTATNDQAVPNVYLPAVARAVTLPRIVSRKV